MPDSRTQHFIDLCNQVELPTSDTITEDNKRRYEEAIEVLSSYRGHPQVLEQALEKFAQTGSRPLAYAGLAHVLLRTSFLSGNDYDMDGVKVAMKWFEKAQVIAPESYEINMLLYEIHRVHQNNEQMRATLDKIGQLPEAQSKYSFALKELSYWGDVDDLSQQEIWLKEAFARAKNNDEKRDALHILGDSMLENRHYQRAAKVYGDVEKLSPNDEWLLHNMSIAHYAMKDMSRAAHYNQRALAKREFGAARHMQKTIEKYCRENGIQLVDLNKIKSDHARNSKSESAKRDNKSRDDKLWFNLLMVAVCLGGLIFFGDTLRESTVGPGDSIRADYAFMFGAALFGIISLVQIINMVRKRQ